jgi:hypothetical protein
MFLKYNPLAERDKEVKSCDEKYDYSNSFRFMK